MVLLSESTKLYKKFFLIDAIPELFKIIPTCLIQTFSTLKIIDEYLPFLSIVVADKGLALDCPSAS